jgi:pimeloyl-ACP methyl ester carboxylesterase
MCDVVGGFNGNDQQILICLPENPPEGNGYTLIIYAHGYVYPQEPLALPFEEIGGNVSVIDHILNSGMAFATTSYSANGYAVQQAEEDLIALVNYFNTTLAEADKVILVGASEGGLITTMMLERHSDLFDGGLAMCGPIGGMTEQLKYIGDFRVVFDYFFPWVFPYGLDPRDDEAALSFYSEVGTDEWEDFYEPRVEFAIESRPLRTLRLFDITDAAWNWFDSASFAETAKTVLRYSILGTYDLLDTAASEWEEGGCEEDIGMPYDNNSPYRWYDASWWLNRRVERIDGDTCAQVYISQYYDPTGMLQVPLVTLHNISDPAVPYWHEALYKELVDSEGNSHNLTVLPPVLTYGHCNFKPWQVLGAFYILLNQVNN